MKVILKDCIWCLAPEMQSFFATYHKKETTYLKTKTRITKKDKL